MKKKIFYSILILSVLFVVSFVTIYAAFTMTHHYEAQITHHEIKNATLTNSVENSKVNFTKPGDQINITYSLKNSDNKEYEYYYSFEWGTTDYSDSPYLNMIYVYQNGEYCGMLKDYLVSGILPKKDLPFKEYVFSNETRQTLFTFELHNESSSLPVDGLSIEFKISANISTTNVQKVVFANSSDFDKAISNSNNGGNQTIVLTDNVSMPGFEVKKDMTIDLCGKTMSLTNPVTLSENVNLKILDSRGGGSVTGEGFVISHETSFIELDAPVSKINKTAYNKTKLIEILENYYDTKNIIYANEDYDLFGYYSVYGLTATSNDVTINNGIVESKTYNTNSVVVINVDGVDYEFKYIGNNSSIVSSILNDSLEHMALFMDPMNGIQVANDLFLPNSIKEYNATISWYSSDKDILSNDGKVQEEQGNVLLTATIKVFETVVVQDYYIYIIQPDNLSKLQYLIARVEQGVTVGEGTDSAYTLSSELRAVGEQKYLPVSGDVTIPYHYTLWTEGLDLGIIDIEYSKESMYQYIDLQQEVIESKVTEASVSLTQITYSKYARVEIIATFDNGETISSYITIAIELEESDLAYEVFEDVQLELDKVDVLQNILNTRKDEGVKYERGDFYLPARIDVVELEYVSSNEAFYKVVPIDGLDEEGNPIIEKYQIQFVDLKYLDISDKRISIKCKIIERSPYKEITSKDLYFSVPGAITTDNFKSMYVENGQIKTNQIFDMGNNNIKRLFYSIKLQTLQQTEYPYFDKKTEGGIVNLVDVENASDIYSLGEYILIEDIDSVNKLMFEYGRTETILNYYDLEVLLEIFKWATHIKTDSNPITAVKDTAIIKDHVDSNLEWIENDGNSEISDGEMAVILSYGEKYTGFNEIFNQVINPLDIYLTDDELSNMLEALAQDKTYVSILNWIKSPSKDIPLHKWLLMLDETSEYYDSSYLEEELDSLASIIVNEKNISLDFLKTVNGFTDKFEVTNEEERLIIYYVITNHPTKYEKFILAWQSQIKHQSNLGSIVKEFSKTTLTSYRISSSETRNPSECYDPIFAVLYDWAFKVGDSGTSPTLIELGTELTGLPVGDLFKDEMNYTRLWYRFNYILGTSYGDQITVNEWKVISKYLNSLGITSVDGVDISNANDNIIVADIQNLTNNSGVVTIINYNHSILGEDDVPVITNTFLNSVIDEVNKIYTSTAASNYTKLINWAKSEEVAKVTWRDVLNDQTLSMSSAELDNIRIKDCTSNISLDEQLVLKYYFENVVLGSSVSDLAKQALTSIFLGLNMEFSETNISQGYNSILLAVNDTGGFEGIIDAIRNMGIFKPLDSDYFDNLSTISEKEIKELIMIKPDETNYVNAIKSAFDAYNITVTKTGDSFNISVTKVTTGDYDRTLNESDENYIINELNAKLSNNTDVKYTHITIDNITSKEVDVFRILTYYEHLVDVSFRGTSAVYLFDSNVSANSTFSLVANSATKLEKLSMNYCGISDISSVSSMLNLKHLNLRNNYKKDSYNGLENISELIHLNDLKNSDSSYPKIEYLNVYNTDVTLRRGEVVLGKLYQENKSAELYMDVYGEEKKYPFSLNNSEEAIYALSLLYELDIMSGTYMILPNEVFRNVINNGINQTVSYDITWEVVVANSLVKMTNVLGYNRLDRLSLETGEVTISASITLGDITETRYFVITLI